MGCGRRAGLLLGGGLIAATLAAGEAAAESSFHVVGGVGFLSFAGGADAAAQRDGGWTAHAGLRRRITDRISLGVSGSYGRAGLNADDFFAERDVFLTEPDRHLAGGDLTMMSASFDGLYEYPVDRSTVVYGRLGVGIYQWSIDDVFVNSEELGIEDQVPPQITYEDESAVGGNVGAGVRFPLGESAGLWAELVVEIVGGASGGSLQMIPLRAGISIP